MVVWNLLYLEDTFDLLEVPEVSDGDHDGWSYLQLDFAFSHTIGGRSKYYL